MVVSASVGGGVILLLLTAVTVLLLYVAAKRRHQQEHKTAPVPEDIPDYASVAIVQQAFVQQKSPPKLPQRNMGIHTEGNIAYSTNELEDWQPANNSGARYLEILPPPVNATARLPVPAEAGGSVPEAMKGPDNAERKAADTYSECEGDDGYIDGYDT